ncbi:Aspartic proteinase 3 [Candida viswanathii]|uniref:Aspartic proteinase 3 n=1 Tax=Candida viswanathii TaxID=5486 RepID=A0A367Y2T9_9ASCO|nr:Aspartic proteinase 3 [Candida viswanathii]
MNLLLLCICFTSVLGGSLKLSFEQQSDKLKKRQDGDLGVYIQDRDDYFSVDLGFGSNNDTVTVLIDTGSADLWVPASNAVCSSNSDSYPYKGSSSSNASEPTDLCRANGTFDWQRSTTFHKNSTAFDITYADSTFAEGFFGMDSVHIGSTIINNAIFGVANQSDDVGVLGLGLPQLESSYDNYYNSTMYENFPQKLKSEGIIDRVLYSINLGYRYGEILFGAIDHSAHNGDLVTLPIQYSDNGIRDQFIVELDSILLTRPDEAPTLVSLNATVLLDTGSSYSWFPKETLKKLTKLLDGKKTKHGYFVNTTEAAYAYLQLSFGGTNILAPVAKSFSKYEPDMARLDYGQQGPYDGTDIVLGKDILRYMYLVYDLESLEISISKARSSIIYPGMPQGDVEIVGSDGKFNKSPSWNVDYDSGASFQSKVPFLLLMIYLMITL